MNVPSESTPLQRLADRRVFGGAPLVRRCVASVESYRVDALEAGEDGPPVVLLHGLAGSGRWWDRNIPALAGSFRVLAPDLIGFVRHRTAGPLPPISRLAELLVAWFDTLGLARVHLIGHSMGGQIAAQIAARFPPWVERLVLVDPAGVPWPRRPGALARVALGLAPPRRWGDVRFLPTLAGDAWLAGPRVLIRALLSILHDDVRQHLPLIRAPTLIVWGARDPLVPLEHAREFRRLIPHARLLIVPGAAHNPMIDRPEAFNAAVLRFLHGAQVGE